MTDPTAPNGPTDYLEYKGHRVRIVLREGVPYFSASDLVSAMDLTPYVLRHANSPTFPQFARLKVREDGEKGKKPRLATYLSRVGVLFFTMKIDAAKFQSLANWARKEADKLCPEPQPADPTMFLTALPGPTMPPRPKKYSGWLAEWRELEVATMAEDIDMLFYETWGK